jgi:hypothetical protein
LICTSQTASQIPHKAAMTKKIILLEELGCQTRRVTMRATCRDKAKHMTGLLPVILIKLPMKMAAIPLQIPKQIMTKPILLMPQPQDTYACKD